MDGTLRPAGVLDRGRLVAYTGSTVRAVLATKETTMKTFEIGKSYAYGNSYITVVKRTAKTITTSGGAKVGLNLELGVELTKPSDNRLHIARADRPAKV